MKELTLEIPEPVYEHLERIARVSELSPSAFLERRLCKEFGVALSTAAQAKKEAQKVLRATIGSLLRPGTPFFDAMNNMECCGKWRIPVLPNLRLGSRKPVGEISFNAYDGKLLTEKSTIYEIARQASAQMGIEKLPGDLQEQLDKLLDAQNERTLTDEEQQKLEKLITRWEIFQLNNLLRMTEQLRTPTKSQDFINSVRANSKAVLRTLYEKNEVTSNS